MLILKALFDSELCIYLIKGTTIFGRKAQIVLNEKSISREHMKIETNGVKSVLTDLKSKHFTYLNDQKITTATLKANDIITIGMTLKFKVIEINFQISKSQVNFEATKIISVTENIKECQFLVMDQIVITLKLLLALILQKPIVKQQLFDTSFSSNDIKQYLPKNDKFSSIDLGENIKRRNLFTSKTFILTNSLNQSLGPALKEAGGTVFVNNCKCVKQCSCNLEKTIRFKVQKDFQLFVVDKRLTSDTFKPFQIPQDSIAKAILFANFSKYCVYTEEKTSSGSSIATSSKGRAPSIASTPRSDSRKEGLQRIESTVIFQDSLNDATQDNFLPLETVPVTPKPFPQIIPYSASTKKKSMDATIITPKETKYNETIPTSAVPKLSNSLETIPITPEHARALYETIPKSVAVAAIPVTPIQNQNDIIPNSVNSYIPSKRSQIDIIPGSHIKKPKFDTFDLLDDGDFEELTTPNLKCARSNSFKSKNDAQYLFDSNTASNKEFSHLQTQNASMKNTNFGVNESSSGRENESIKLNTQSFKNTDEKDKSDLSLFKVPVGRPKNTATFEEIEVSGGMVSREEDADFGGFDDFLDELLDMGPDIPYTEAPVEDIQDSIIIPHTIAEEVEVLNDMEIENVEKSMQQVENIVDTEVEELFEDLIITKITDAVENNPTKIDMEPEIDNPDNTTSMVNLKTTSLIVTFSKPKPKTKISDGLPNFKNFKSKSQIKVRMIAVGRVEHDYDLFDEDDEVDKTMKVMEEVQKETFIDSDFEIED
jgi:hypothetical protein